MKSWADDIEWRVVNKLSSVNVHQAILSLSCNWRSMKPAILLASSLQVLHAFGQSVLVYAGARQVNRHAANTHMTSAASHQPCKACIAVARWHFELYGIQTEIDE